MINLQLMSMEEYSPVNGETVDLFLIDRSSGLIGLRAVTAECEIHYQEYYEGNPVPSYTSDTDEKMLLIPFNEPFRHICKGNKIVGFELLCLPAVSDEEETYWEKRWFFNVEGNQIHDDDPNNEVLGIMNQDELTKELMK